MKKQWLIAIITTFLLTGCGNAVEGSVEGYSGIWNAHCATHNEWDFNHVTKEGKYKYIEDRAKRDWRFFVLDMDGNRWKGEGHDKWAGDFKVIENRVIAFMMPESEIFVSKIKPNSFQINFSNGNYKRYLGYRDGENNHPDIGKCEIFKE